MNPSASRLLKASPAEREGIVREKIRNMFNLARENSASLLGKGSFGAVRAVKKNGSNYAVKRVLFDETYSKGNGIRSSLPANFDNEVEGLRRVAASPYAIHLIGSEVYDRNAYLLMERLEGMDLQKAIGAKLINDSNIQDIITQLIAGLKSIHDQGLLHLDIKPINLWITPGPPIHIKYIDFGLSCAMPCKKLFESGTIGYMKEKHEDNSGNYTYDQSDDKYALGQTLKYFIEKIRLTPENIAWVQSKILELTH